MKEIFTKVEPVQHEQDPTHIINHFRLANLLIINAKSRSPFAHMSFVISIYALYCCVWVRACNPILNQLRYNINRVCVRFSLRMIIIIISKC